MNVNPFAEIAVSPDATDEEVQDLRDLFRSTDAREQYKVGTIVHTDERLRGSDILFAVVFIDGEYTTWTRDKWKAQHEKIRQASSTPRTMPRPDASWGQVWTATSRYRPTPIGDEPEREG